MNEKVNADLKALKFIFNKNKPYIFPVAIILVSAVLFFQFIIPQFRALLTARNEVKAASLKLEALKENLDVLTNIDENTLDLQLKILNQALPLDKDFIEILNSIHSAAQRTGVSLGTFSFQIGDISNSESDDAFPVIKLSLPINADVIEVNSFVEAISKTFPLSEIYSIKVGTANSVVDLSFYYKQLDTSGYSQDVRIMPVSQKALTLINQLESENTSFSLESSIVSATSSASQ